MSLSIVWKKGPLRPTAIRRLIELVVVVGLVAGVWYGQQLIQSQRQDYLSARLERERRPATKALLGEVEADINAQSKELSQLANALPAREDLGEYISFLEGRASKHRIEVEITDVGDDMPLDSKEDPPVYIASGYGVVRLQLIGSGTTSALLEFMHDVEHSQFVSAVPKWDIRSGTRGGSRTNVPSGIGTPPGDAVEEVPSDNQLSVEIIIITKSDGPQTEE